MDRKQGKSRIVAKHGSDSDSEGGESSLHPTASKRRRCHGVSSQDSSVPSSAGGHSSTGGRPTSDRPVSSRAHTVIVSPLSDDEDIMDNEPHRGSPLTRSRETLEEAAETDTMVFSTVGMCVSPGGESGGGGDGHTHLHHQRQSDSPREEEVEEEEGYSHSVGQSDPRLSPQEMERVKDIAPSQLHLPPTPPPLIHTSVLTSPSSSPNHPDSLSRNDTNIIHHHSPKHNSRILENDSVQNHHHHQQQEQLSKHLHLEQQPKTTSRTTSFSVADILNPKFGPAGGVCNGGSTRQTGPCSPPPLRLQGRAPPPTSSVAHLPVPAHHHHHHPLLSPAMLRRLHPGGPPPAHNHHLEHHREMREMKGHLDKEEGSPIMEERNRHLNGKILSNFIFKKRKKITPVLDIFRTLHKQIFLGVNQWDRIFMQSLH